MKVAVEVAEATERLNNFCNTASKTKPSLRGYFGLEQSVLRAECEKTTIKQRDDFGRDTSAPPLHRRSFLRKASRKHDCLLRQTDDMSLRFDPIACCSTEFSPRTTAPKRYHRTTTAPRQSLGRLANMCAISQPDPIEPKYLFLFSVIYENRRHSSPPRVFSLTSSDFGINGAVLPSMRGKVDISEPRFDTTQSAWELLRASIR